MAISQQAPHEGDHSSAMAIHSTSSA
ncbi:hypothetical protein M6B38_255720 [Iris pallida]|uniref:Uncharacterized protein n=1 Tax=Iris pallida TaxID=29817 RepID=A0AAX6GC14_IRIPA|nr:hypothetical protein M6B38_229510 [Iris pallida]KAJ6825788.1 hypothetical protein M6B38_375465 [Iris pallida]KAJ6852443.1 hypothetical protein M6B38_255720 [Iris pallida]